MTFEFAPAVRENVRLIIAFAGASGAGKTKSALEVATGLVGPGGKIGMIDTEARRGLHYANPPGENDPAKYKFLHSDMLPPFRPIRFEEGIDAAEAQGIDCLIVDSFSHEYDGDGGIFDWASELEAGGTKSPGNWKLPKQAHKHLVQVKMLQARCHLIFCLRAEEKIKITARGGKLLDGSIADKTVIESLGWVPICEKRFMYEMTLSLTLRPDDPGKPQYDLPHKMQDQHRPFFPEGEFITRETGARLAEWARGGKAPDTVDAYAREVAAHIRGDDAAQLANWWHETEQRRADLKIPADRLGKMAAALTTRLNELKGEESGE